MDRTTQMKKTLQALEDAGSAGVPSEWFWENRIMRGSARIYDLKKLGYVIDSELSGSGCRYFLRENNQMEMEIGA